MYIGSIQGGTHAGWRRLKQPVIWVCSCGAGRNGYSCPHCGDRRP